MVTASERRRGRGQLTVANTPVLIWDVSVLQSSCLNLNRGSGCKGAAAQTGYSEGGAVRAQVTTALVSSELPSVVTLMLPAVLPATTGRLKSR